VDDSLDGHITVSHKGIHFPETKYGFSEGHVFWEDEVDTDLTHVIQSTEVLHISIPCNSATHKVITSGETGAWAGQMDSVCNLNISSTTADGSDGQTVNIVVCSEEPAPCFPLNAQAQAPDTAAAKLDEEATCLRRATDFTESLDDTDLATVSSPWRPVSLPFTFFVTPYKFTGSWYRQITPLGIRNTRSPGTNHIPKAPRFTHSLGSIGSIPHEDPQLSHQAAEVTLGVSFNDQSQAPDIPGASSRAVFLRHTAPLPAQSKVPNSYALRTCTEEILVSLNAQGQAPYDPSQALLDYHMLSLRAYMEILLASFNVQEQAPDDILVQHHQWDPCLCVENFRHCSQEPARLTTKQDSPHLSRHQVSQVSTQELQFERIMILPYQGVSRFEFQLYCLRIPFVSQGVVCSHSAVLQVSWTFGVIVFKEDQAPDGFHAQHRQWGPCLSVENSRHYSQEPASLTEMVL
jgi:hypothetical protein